jgi:predicted AlkP superfamily phosphohydrolase/phosphomutase
MILHHSSTAFCGRIGVVRRGDGRGVNVSIEVPLRVVVLDGADDRVVEQLLDAGRMPVLASLAERSARVRAETVGGIFEEGVWPSVFTGAPLGDHASQHFVRFDHETQGLDMGREPDGLEPFWLHLPGRGEQTLVVDVPQIHPHPSSGADEVCCWSAWSTPHRPVATSRRLRRELGRRRVPDFHEFDSLPTLDDERAFSRRMSAAAEDRLRRLSPAAARRRVACIGVHELHGTAHVLGHHWLDGHPHRPWTPDPTLVTDVYEAVDRSLAPMVADPRSNVVVIAAQGFAPANSSNPVLDGLLERAGLSAQPGAEGPSPVPGRTSLLDLLRRWMSPELRERLAVRLLPEKVQLRLMSQQFRDGHDWTRTRVFATPSWTTGYIRVNLAGRERHGVVSPDDYDRLLDEVAVLVGGLVEASTGAPMVRRVIRMREAFPGARAEELPDLAIEWALDHPVGHVAHPALGEWTAPVDYHRHRWSDHHGRALAYLAGPGVGSVDGVQEVDILGAASTFLHLAGVRPPSSLPAPWSAVLR